MKKEVLLGDEAVALGAIHAGISAAYAYPGTPSSEIMESLIKIAAKDPSFKAVWSVNEKTAYEEALGASFSGKRSMVSFKHVGLNAAADPFMNSAVTGANGGMVVVSADDPGMHSSQNEQDSRFFAEFAKILCFEPADQQECYDMALAAFEASEKFRLPVMFRLVTRLAHSRSAVATGERRGQNELNPGVWNRWTLLPGPARKGFDMLLANQPKLAAYSEGSPFNHMSLDGDKRLGVITAGIAVNYLKEAIADGPAVPFLKISTYPLPVKLIKQFIGSVDEVLVLEDGYPLIESRLAGIMGVPGKLVHGRLDGTVPSSGELTPEIARKALGLPEWKAMAPAAITVPNRPPQLCVGCPHADTYKALKEALASFGSGSVFGDIGCYTLGALPPYSAISTTVCMGASIGMARGASDVGIHPAVSVIGDSTFVHSGMTPLLSAAAADADITVVVVDNGTVAMTGGQPSYAGGKLPAIIEAIGVPREHIRVIEPLPKNHAANVAVLKEEMAHHGTSVVISKRECIQYPSKKGAKK